MFSPLQQRIATLRTRVRWLLTIHGLGAVVAAVVGAIVVLGWADYLIRFQDRGLRVIGWLTLLGVLGWTCYRYLYRPLTARLGDTDLAARLESHFPSLDDRLLSSVEFLRQSEDDPKAGSASLRRAVIAQTTAEAERLDFSQALDRRPSVNVVVLAAAVVLVAGILAARNPAAARTALVRLLDPLGSTAWPQTTHLKLRKAAERVARGQPFEVEVVDAAGASLPAEVRIHYRFIDPDGKASEEVDRMQLIGSVMVAIRENAARSFSFRVEGGDDRSMPWRAVEVLEPPAVRSLAAELFPPAYTGWPTEKLDAAGSIRALVGTRITLAGEATKPLRSAAVLLDGKQEIPARLADDALHFTLSDGLAVEKSATYSFKLIDQDGLTGGSESRGEIRAVPDMPPTVVIEQPTGNLFVTPRAAIPLRIVARDDQAIRQASIVFSRADAPTQETSVPIYTGPEHAPAPAADRAAGDETGDRRVLEHRWNLEELGLAAGTQLVLFATATDYRPQTGKSESRRVSVITPEELQERMAARQNVLLTELSRVLKAERDSRSQVQALEIIAHETGGLGQLDIDRLQAAELNHRQAQRSLTSRTDGAAMHVLALLADLENNRIDNPDFQRRMNALLAEIDRLDRGPLPTVGRELTAAIKTSQIRLQSGEKSRDAATEAALGRAGRQQDEVIASLEAMLDQLHQWDDYRRFHRDVAQLLHDQEELARQSAEVGRQTLTKDVKDLLPQELADLRILAGRQLEYARRLDRIEQEMDQAAGQLRQNDPLAADTIADALAESRRLAIGTAMRTVGGQLQENRIGQAVAGHKQIVQNLQEVLDILANHPRQELPRLMKKLREAEKDAESLRQQQEDLRKEMQRAGQQTNAAQRKAELDRLAERQEQLRQEAERLARRLERLQAEEAPRTMRRVTEEMRQAGEGVKKGNSDKAVQNAEKAEKDLEEVVKDLRDELGRVQVKIDIEKRAELEDALKNLHRQEQGVLDETQRLDALQRGGPLTRGQVASLSDLARLQQSVQAETGKATESMKGKGGFQLALSAAAAEMGRAASLLNHRETGQSTQQAEQAALARLALVLKALEPEKPADPKSGDPGNGHGPDKKNGQSHGILPLAELKLLKLMQEDLGLRTKNLEAALAGRQPTDDQRRQYNELSEEQGRLADLVYQLLKTSQPEDAPAEPEEKKEEAP
jgi:hypothetical protein